MFSAHCSRSLPDEFWEVVGEQAMTVLKMTSLLVAKTPRVHIFGHRSSYPSAYYLSLCLEQLRDDVFFLETEGGRLTESLMRLRQNDLVVLISFPRYSKDTLLAAEEARAAGCPILAITDTIFSPLAVNATATLLAPYESTSFFNTNIGVFGILEILLSQVGHFLQKKGAAKLQRHNELLKRWSILMAGKEALSLTPFKE